MGTRTYEGPLTLLGNSTWVNGCTTYSVVEIGGVTIRRLECADELDTYLRVALPEGKQIKLVVAQMGGFDKFILFIKYLAAYLIVLLVLATLRISWSAPFWLAFGWIPTLFAYAVHARSAGGTLPILKSIHMDGKEYSS